MTAEEPLLRVRRVAALGRKPLPLFALEGDGYEASVLGTSMGDTSGGCQAGVAKYLS